MVELIRMKATWEYNPEKIFPDELHLWANCPECSERVDMLYYYCLYLPKILKLTNGGNNNGNNLEITVRCPLCEFKFMLVNISYNENN